MNSIARCMLNSRASLMNWPCCQQSAFKLFGAMHSIIQIRAVLTKEMVRFNCRYPINDETWLNIMQVRSLKGPSIIRCRFVPVDFQWIRGSFLSIFCHEPQHISCMASLRVIIGLRMLLQPSHNVVHLCWTSEVCTQTHILSGASCQFAHHKLLVACIGGSRTPKVQLLSLRKPQKAGLLQACLMGSEKRSGLENSHQGDVCGKVLGLLCPLKPEQAHRRITSIAQHFKIRVTHSAGLPVFSLQQGWQDHAPAAG